MKASRIKNSITYFFVVLFLSMKLVGLHALSHTDDKDHAIHCTVCDFAITQNVTPVLAPDIQDFSIKNIEFVVEREITNNYSFVISSAITPSQLFSRPPPSLL